MTVQVLSDEREYPILQGDGSIKMKLWGGRMADWTPDMETKASGKIAVKDFVYDYIVPQMTEFIDKYDPDLLWYDADWSTRATENGSYDITAYLYNTAEDRMLSIGKWLEKNGEAIYGTRIVAPYSTPAIDYTQSKDGKTVYAIVKKPTTEITLACALPGNVTVSELASGRRLELVRDGKSVKVHLSDDLAAAKLPFVLVCK